MLFATLLAVAMHERGALSAARIGVDLLRALPMPSSVNRKTFADCYARRIREIMQRMHEAAKGWFWYEGAELVW